MLLHTANTVLLFVFDSHTPAFDQGHIYLIHAHTAPCWWQHNVQGVPSLTKSDYILTRVSYFQHAHTNKSKLFPTGTHTQSWQELHRHKNLMALNWTKLSKPLTFNTLSHDHDTRNDLGGHSHEFSRSRMSHYWPINSMQVLQKFSTTKNLHTGTCTTDLSRKNHTKPDWSG